MFHSLSGPPSAIVTTGHSEWEPPGFMPKDIHHIITYNGEKLEITECLSNRNWLSRLLCSHQNLGNCIATLKNRFYHSYQNVGDLEVYLLC